MIGIKETLAIILSVGILDGLWINANLPFYTAVYSGVQGSPLRPNLVGVVFAYVFIFTSFAFIVLPHIRASRGTFVDCLREGGLVGLCTYGIYNFTNLAVFTGYSPVVAVVDTVWGTILYTVVAAILSRISRI